MTNMRNLNSKESVELNIKAVYTRNKRIYNLISVPQITRHLLGDAIISSKRDPHNDGKKEKRSYRKIKIIKPC